MLIYTEVRQQHILDVNVSMVPLNQSRYELACLTSFLAITILCLHNLYLSNLPTNIFPHVLCQGGVLMTFLT
jgi:hypothetical protein